MREDLLEVVAILDMSGSMGPIANDTIGGFNTYLDELCIQELEVRMTLILFNHDYRIVFEHVNVRNCPRLDRATYKPNGFTALTDAMGVAIENMTQHISKQPEN